MLNQTLKSWANELIDSARDIAAVPRADNDAYVLAMRTVGLFVVTGFWSRDRCAAARSAIDALLSTPTTRVSTDALGSDQRIFGAENLSPALDLLHDEQISKIAHSLHGRAPVGTTLAARLEFRSGNLGSGGGWHRDSARAPQFKTILYLSDVDIDHGPFEYILGSASRHSLWESYRTGTGRPGQTRFDTHQGTHIADRFRERLITATAPEGTLLIANTRGVHRGRPIVGGSRYALTNYWFHRSIPAHIDQLVNRPVQT